MEDEQEQRLITQEEQILEDEQAEIKLKEEEKALQHQLDRN